MVCEQYYYIRETHIYWSTSLSCYISIYFLHLTHNIVKLPLCCERMLFFRCVDVRSIQYFALLLLSSS